MARLTNKVLENLDENNFLGGITLKSAILQEIPDRVVTFGTKTLITVDKQRVVLTATVISDTEEEKNDTDNVLSILAGLGYWSEIESYTEEDNAGFYTIGELYLPYELSDVKKTSIAGVSMTSITFSIPLSEDGETMYYIKVTYVEGKTWLHGLSPFSGKSLTVTQLEKFLPLLFDNSLGQNPAIVRYFIKGKAKDSKAVMHVVNTNLTNFFSLNTDSKVMLLNAPFARLGIDYANAKGEFSITEDGFNLTLTLNNNALLELFI